MSNIKFKDFINGIVKHLDESSIAEELGVTIEIINLWKEGVEPPPPILDAIRTYFEGALNELETLKEKPLSILNNNNYLKNPIAKRLHQKILHDSTLEVLKKYSR